MVKERGYWNRNCRRSGGDRRLVLEAAPITKVDVNKMLFFAELEKLSKDHNIPYIYVLKRARDDGFFDATNEVIEQIAKDTP